MEYDVQTEKNARRRHFPLFSLTQLESLGVFFIIEIRRAKIIIHIVPIKEPNINLYLQSVHRMQVQILQEARY